MRKIKAVIFDLDDTLIAEKQYIESGYRHIAELLSSKLASAPEEIYQTLIRLLEASPKNVFNRLFDERNVSYSKEDIIALVHAYRAHLPSIDFFADVMPCLESLKQQGIQTGIITDGFAIAQQQKLKALDAARYFDEIIVTDELGPDRSCWKPHPKAFETMREKLGVAFSEMMYVGDNPAKDFHIRTRFPITTVRIHRDGVHAGKEYLDGIREHHTIHSLDELTGLLEIEPQHADSMLNP